jgi:hypothetical protein
MNHTLRSVGRILVAPWQQRRNQSGPWGFAVIAALSVAAGLALAVALGAFGPRSRPTIGAAEAGAVVAFGLLLTAAWAMLVASVLEQNHPTFARLAPGHVARLRCVLLLAWGAAIAYAAAVPGAFAHASLAWAVGASAALALLAACIRWPVLWLFGCVAPFFTTSAVHRAWVDGLLQLAAQAWQAGPMRISVTIVLAGAVLLLALVQRGGQRHAASYAARRQRGLRLRSSMTGVQSTRAEPRIAGWSARISAWSYAWWMRRLLAGPGPDAMARLQLGFGPAVHWSALLGFAVRLLVLAGLFFAAIALSPMASLLPGLLAVMSLGLMYGFVERVTQAPARLHQTRREQALLILLPGVPRRKALNRWLSGHLTTQFVVAWLAAVAWAALLGAAADRLRPGVTAETIGQGRSLLAIAMLPPCALLWRSWARMAAPTPLGVWMAALPGLACGGAAYAMHQVGGYGYAPIGVVYAASTLAWCGWRWHRMADEPSAFPIGRLHR